MQPHVIRLRGPWQCRRESAAPDAEQRVTMPCTWELLPAGGGEGQWRLTRRFHRPSGITPDLAVWLVVDGCAAGTTVVLNGLELDAVRDGMLAAEITYNLADQNELVLLAARPSARNPAPSGPFAEVRLEIRQRVLI